MNIYVGNLPPTATEEELSTAFQAFGKVATASIIKDKFSGESRGFGFVEMPEKAEALAAIEGLNGSEFNGRKLTANEARPRTGGQRGGGRDRRNDSSSGGRRGGYRSW